MWDAKDIKILNKNEKTRKHLTRDGPVADSRRREIVLTLLDLNPVMCEMKWETVLKT